MKICLIGPSCAGKTTLARELKKIIGSNTLDLDQVFIDISRPRKIGEIFYRSKDYGEKIVNDFIKNNNSWIIEGVFPVRDVMEKAEIIIFMKPFFLVPIFRQWHRFFTDNFQRKTFGFKINATFLTPDIFKQYFSKRGCNALEDPTQFSIKKYELMLSDYTYKTFCVDIVSYGLEKNIIDIISISSEPKKNVR